MPIGFKQDIGEHSTIIANKCARKTIQVQIRNTGAKYIDNSQDVNVRISKSLFEMY